MAYLIDTVEDMLRQEMGRLMMERIFLDFQLSAAKQEIEDLKAQEDNARNS